MQIGMKPPSPEFISVLIAQICLLHLAGRTALVVHSHKAGSLNPILGLGLLAFALAPGEEYGGDRENPSHIAAIPQRPMTA